MFWKPVALPYLSFAVLTQLVVIPVSTSRPLHLLLVHLVLSTGGFDEEPKIELNPTSLY